MSTQKWGVNRLSVSGMISAAKNSLALYEDLMSLGYTDAELPVWWYSPARVQASKDMSSDVPESVKVSSDVPESGDESSKVVLEPVPPKTPVAIVDGLSRPDITPQDNTGLLSTPQDFSAHHRTSQHTTGQSNT